MLRLWLTLPDCHSATASSPRAWQPPGTCRGHPAECRWPSWACQKPLGACFAVPGGCGPWGRLSLAHVASLTATVALPEPLGACFADPGGCGPWGRLSLAHVASLGACLGPGSPQGPAEAILLSVAGHLGACLGACEPPGPARSPWGPALLIQVGVGLGADSCWLTLPPWVPVLGLAAPRDLQRPSC